MLYIYIFDCIRVYIVRIIETDADATFVFFSFFFLEYFVSNRKSTDFILIHSPSRYNTMHFFSLFFSSLKRISVTMYIYTHVICHLQVGSQGSFIYTLRQLCKMKKKYIVRKYKRRRVV